MWNVQEDLQIEEIADMFPYRGMTREIKDNFILFAI